MGRWAWIAVATLLSVVLVGAVAVGAPAEAGELAAPPPGIDDPDSQSAGHAGAAALAPTTAQHSHGTERTRTAASALVAPGVGSGDQAGARDAPTHRAGSPLQTKHPLQEESPLQEERPFALQQSFDRSQFRVLIEPDGDAVWTFRYERPIDDESDRTSFRTYAERFRSGRTELSRDFRNRSLALADSAAAETGREMNATAFDRGAGIEQTTTREVGYVELTFRWTSFARVGDGEVRAGDVFEGGLYLGDRQTFVYEAAEGLTFSSAAPEASHDEATLESSDTVSWTGELEFPPGHPRAVFDAQGGGAAGVGETGGATMAWMLGGGVLVLLLALAVVVLRRGEVPDVPFRRSGADASPSSETAPDGTDAEGAVSEPTDPPSTLSDDRRVLRLLQSADGRMKQSEIVEETEWSKSKVSMLLSEMEEEDAISKIQVGRENIIALEGHEPEAAGSPFEETE